MHEERNLAAALGHADDARVVIVTATGLGACHAATGGVYECLRNGEATSAGLMVPCPWARDAASRYRGEDVGVHLTLNAEHELYRWGPITHAPSLLDGNGGFPVTLDDLWDHAALDEARRECRAQIERAIWWGFDVSHLDSHLGALEMRPEFFDVYLELAIEFRLPLRLGSAADERRAGFPFRMLAREEGVLFPDDLVVLGDGARQALEDLLFDLRPGVTEIQLAPALDTPELRSLTPAWARHVEHHQLLTSDRDWLAIAGRAGVRFVDYRQLRALQRKG